MLGAVNFCVASVLLWRYRALLRRPAFLIAGLVPAVLAVLVIVLARLPQDELRHPLDVAGDARDGGMTGLGASELLSREPGAPSAS